MDGRAHSSYVMIEIIFIVNEGLVLNFNVSLCMYNYIELLMFFKFKENKYLCGVRMFSAAGRTHFNIMIEMIYIVN